MDCLGFSNNVYSDTSDTCITSVVMHAYIYDLCYDPLVCCTYL